MQTDVVASSNSITRSFRVFANDIKLSHSVFALPFVGVALTLTEVSSVSATRLVEIILCMIFARSFAMGMNRYLDREIDAENGRTVGRAIPSGKLSETAYLLLTAAFGVAFVVTTFSLSTLAGVLALPLLVVLAAYSFMKKLTWLTHWYLGVCLGLAPVASEIALFDRVTLPVAMIGLAVAFWTAGFDLLYSLQDREFDVNKGLHSVPAKLGHRAAIWLSRASFAVMTGILFYVGLITNAGFWWFLGVAVVSGILTWEHWIIRDAMVHGTSNKINVAFFNLNAMVSVLFFVFAIMSAVYDR